MGEVPLYRGVEGTLASSESGVAGKGEKVGGVFIHYNTPDMYPPPPTFKFTA